MFRSDMIVLLLSVLLAVVGSGSVEAADEGQLVKLQDKVTGRPMWRITHDPTVSHTHRYFNVPAFSPSGRWLAISGRS